MRESAKSAWRQELNEEGDHPYVDIMPCADEAQQMKKDKKKKKEKEEVKEGFFDGKPSKKEQEAARERIRLRRAKWDAEAKSKEQTPAPKDPWATHPDDAKVFAKEELDLSEHKRKNIKGSNSYHDYEELEAKIAKDNLDRRQGRKGSKKVDEGYVPHPHEANEKQIARHMQHARNAAKEGGDTGKHLSRAEALKSPLKRKLDLSAQKEKKMEQKRRELYSKKEQ